MKRYSYAERDYTFGQRMLTLRTHLGLTQAGLAALLGVSRRAVSKWESGSNYPTAGHLQHLLELGVRQRVFAPGREEEEIRAFWQVAPLAPVQMLEAVDGLRRRSLAENGQRAGSFTLQSVVLEYVTDRLVTTAKQEIEQGRLRLLREHGLSQAQAREYERQTQERLLLTPLLNLLHSVYRERAEVEERLRGLLSTLRGWDEQAQGYGPANLVALLRLLRGYLRGLDLSQLALRGIYLQGVEMQEAKLSGALMRESVFTQSFDAIWGVAISRNGQYWAAASQRGEVRVWREAGQILHRVWQAHTDFVIALACSPDERTLASASFDGSVKLWDVESRTLLWSGQHPKSTLCLAFSPDGSQLASGGADATVRFWDAKLGTPLEEMPHPGSVFVLAWSSDGRSLASGDTAGTIRLWERHPAGPTRCMQTLSSGQCLHVQEGHQDTVQALKVSPDGRRLASCGDDGAIVLWDLERGQLLRTLRRDRPYERLNITSIRGLSDAQKASLSALGAFEATPRDENQRQAMDVKRGEVT